MSSKPSVLFVLTSHNKLGDTDTPTGWYLPEAAHPYHVLEPVANITIASPKGGEAPVDPRSVELYGKDDVSKDFLENKTSVWKNTSVLSTFVGKSKDFDAVFYVGGHGPEFDLANNEDSLKLINEFAEAGKIVAAVCHGQAALLNAKLSDGKYLLDGSEVTGFSDVEEELYGTAYALSFSLEQEMKKRGGEYVKAAEPWGVKLTTGRGGKLIMGQNPSSSYAVGEAIKKAITA